MKTVCLSFVMSELAVKSCAIQTKKGLRERSRRLTQTSGILRSQNSLELPALGKHTVKYGNI